MIGAWTRRRVEVVGLIRTSFVRTEDRRVQQISGCRVIAVLLEHDCHSVGAASTPRLLYWLMRM